MTDNALIDSDDIDENYNNNDDDEHDGGDDNGNDAGSSTKRSGTIKNFSCILSTLKVGTFCQLLVRKTIRG